MMDGSIQLESQYGQGTTFSFTCQMELPTEEKVNWQGRMGDSDILKKEEDSPEISENNPLKILVDDDDDRNCEVLSRIAQKQSWHMVQAASGIEGVEAFENQPFDLVIMDIHMPAMNGYQATVAMREMENGEEITPVLALTANALAGERDRCTQADMDDYLAKPFSMEQLLSKVQQWTNK